MSKYATKLRTLADGMDAAIDAKMNPGVANQNMTHRRIAIARSMRQDGERLQRVQKALRRLAEAHANDDWADLLQVYGQAPKLLTKSAIEKLEFEGRIYIGIDREGRTQYTPSVLHRLAGDTGELTPAQKIRRMEENLVGLKIPGFFPTPRELSDRLVSIAGIGPGMRVLEPSAGKGDLADRIRAQAPFSELHVIEISQTLREILRAKGFEIVGEDLFDFRLTGSAAIDGAVEDARYDRIIQNPPFEDGQDMAHVRYCFEQLLRPGGRLVSIVSEGPFFRSDRKATDFREWLEPKLAREPEKVQNAFEGVQAFRQTGVAVRIVVLDKP